MARRRTGAGAGKAAKQARWQRSPKSDRRGPFPVSSHPPSPQLLAMVEHMLSVEFEGVEAFRAQLPALSVVRACSCGCGTVDFRIDPALAEPAPLELWDDTAIVTEGDGPGSLMLVQCDGYLVCLEHVSDGGPDMLHFEPASIEVEFAGPTLLDSGL